MQGRLSSLQPTSPWGTYRFGAAAKLTISFEIQLKTRLPFQTVIIDNAKDRDSPGYVAGFNGDGFIASAISYTISFLTDFFTPSITAFLGLKVKKYCFNRHICKKNVYPRWLFLWEELSLLATWPLFIHCKLLSFTLHPSFGALGMPPCLWPLASLFLTILVRKRI